MYVHLKTSQISKPGQEICGDIIEIERTPGYTTIICCDGMGSGVRANVAARMCVSRFKELLNSDFSLWNVFDRVARSMDRIRGKSAMYTAFTLARIFATGQCMVYSYEAPAPLMIRHGRAAVMNLRQRMLDQTVVGEGIGTLGMGDGLLLFSDGVSQAGLGFTRPGGWGPEEVSLFINNSLASGIPMARLPETITMEAKKLWEDKGDDISAVLGVCTKAMVVNILTGPSSLPEHDMEVVESFNRLKGFKVICGASTGKMVARCMNRILKIQQDDTSHIAPPRYEISGYDLVSEGTVTLNQVYNIFDVPSGAESERSAVTDLRDFLLAADRVNFVVGLATNPALGDICYTQQGIHERRTIVEMLTRKLKDAGKLVTVEYV